MLRKLPLLALAFYNKKPPGVETSLADFIVALSAAIIDRSPSSDSASQVTTSAISM